MHTRDRIDAKLREALEPESLEVVDDSARHAGHAEAGADGAGTHFNLHIVASRFEGKSLVARHRIVYETLAEELAGSVHALAMQTLTPDEAMGRGGKS